MKNKNLNLLLSGQLVSQTGDKFYMLALSFMVLETTGSAAKMGVVLFAGMLPLVAAGLFSGVVVDRVNRKKLSFSRIFCVVSSFHLCHSCTFKGL